jgi:hypothetical protein
MCSPHTRDRFLQYSGDAEYVRGMWREYALQARSIKSRCSRLAGSFGRGLLRLGAFMTRGAGGVFAAPDFISACWKGHEKAVRATSNEVVVVSAGTFGRG